MMFNYEVITVYIAIVILEGRKLLKVQKNIVSLGVMNIMNRKKSITTLKYGLEL